MWRLGMRLMVVALSTGGCASGSGMAREHGATSFDCPSEKVMVRSLGQEDDNFYEVSCRGDSEVVECDPGFAHCWRDGRGAYAARARASREFNCDPGEIEVKWLMTQIYRVRACGRETNYDCGDGNACYAEGARPGEAETTVVPVIMPMK
jgi:hypothetical protein